MSDITQTLAQIEDGDGAAAEQLLPLVYGELRQLAAAKLAQEKPGAMLSRSASMPNCVLTPHTHFAEPCRLAPRA